MEDSATRWKVAHHVGEAGRKIIWHSWIVEYRLVEITFVLPEFLSKHA